MFRTDLLSIIRSLNSVITASGICHTSYVDCLLATGVAGYIIGSAMKNIVSGTVTIGYNTELTTPMHFN
jgi:hypothetical protein